ncbi:MAG: hypothetical protein M1820_001885 [Bogoriella megaspora]|nr:MAG: hypothetical protein M1820_001885 [Bogoriella megaspora]
MDSTKTRRIDNVDWRLGTYVLAIPVILFYVLGLTGCVSNSPGISNIYMTQLQMGGNPNVTSGTHVNVGYFGICVKDERGSSCLASSKTTSDKLIAKFANGTGDGKATPKDMKTLETLIPVALTIQTKIILCLPAVSGVLFALALICVTLLKRHLKTTGNASATRQRRWFKRAAMNTSWSSVAFSLASVVALHQTTSALAYTTNVISSEVHMRSGVALRVLGWLAFSFSALFAFGVSTIFKVQDGTIKSAGT